MKRQTRTRPVTSAQTNRAPRHRKPFCEQLESRYLLTADTSCRYNGLDPTENPEAEAELFSTSAVRAAEAGSTFGTAYDLGTLAAQQTLGGSVGGSDPSDVMRFSITAQARVNISLTGLAGDIDLSLYNSGGARVAFSNRGGSASESISLTLASGTYYIAVVPWRRASSAYVLTAGAALTQPPPATPTTPTVPTTPSAPVTAFPDVAYYGGSNEWSVNSINAPEAWARGDKGRGVVVAVVDTGVDLNHPDLFSQIWVNPGEIAGNRLDDDHNGYIDDTSGWDFAAGDNNPDDGNGHGTHVAGIIAADDNAFGATGVAPDAKIMPVRVLGNNGSGTMAAVAAGIRYAAQNGADIINLSLGGALSSVIQSAIQYAQQLNVLVVVAAGNESAAAPSYPARYAASMSNVLSVGAHSSSNTIAGFSNRVGTSGAVQVDAPGVNVYSTYLDGRYAFLSGTSMAAPQVAGLAALALSANGNLTVSQLRSLIVQGASRAISGSDARGGINAAVTVALAASGQTSASVTTSATTPTQSTTQSLVARRFAIASRAAAAGVVSWDSSASESRPAPAESQPPLRLAPLRVSNPLATAHDQALVALSWADDWDPDALADDATDADSSRETSDAQIASLRMA